MKTFRPQLESLDDRALPSNSSVSASVVGTSLVINGSNNADVVNIVDNGSGLAGNVFGRINGIALNRLTGGLLHRTAIDHINFFGNNGNDTFNYALPNGLLATQNIYADLGSGNDTYNAIVDLGIDVGARLNQTVTGYGGNDTINTQFNGFLGGVLNSSIDGGNGNNRINYTAGLDTTSTGGVLNTYYASHGNNDVVQINLFDPSLTSAENFQLNANNNNVTVYSAVIGAPNLTTSVLNGSNVTLVNVPTNI
jgi:hypothetical protein